MEIQVLPESGESPTAISELLSALRKAGFEVKLDTPNWGSWVQLEGYQSVISLDLEHRLVSRATLEIDDSDPETVQTRLFQVFAKLKWQGEDDDGLFPLD